MLPFVGTPEIYLLTAHHRMVQRPSSCSHSRQNGGVRALGYYARGITGTGTGRVLTILVRRFRCCACGKTLSFLPSFAHPYRLIQIPSIDRFFSGHYTDADVVRWTYLLRRYWKRFEDWCPELFRIPGFPLGRSPPRASAMLYWNRLNSFFGDASQSTVRLVLEHRVTFLGCYRCHQSHSPQ